MNHLFVGLGGTGGSVLRHLRKSLYLYERASGDQKLAVDYLFVDSDPKSFRDDDPRWTVLGKSLVLPERSRLPIEQADLRTVVRDLQGYSRLRPWLGDREAWGAILNGLNVDSAGGQMRRLGRFLFTMSVERFCNQVQTLVADLQNKTSSNATTIHIFCGLAGGTGSGAIIDAIAQIRRMYPDAASHRIMAYAYLPDMNPPPKWKGRNYFANAYAALLELNALSAGAWTPFDIYTGAEGKRHNIWFNGCYVFSDLNDQGFRARLDDGHQDILEILADFIFHKIVVADQVGWDDLQRFENSENGDATPEAAPGQHVGQRSLRFLGFGLRRLAFPEEAIRESLAYDYANQAYLQLLHNHWDDGHGFLETARPALDSAFVADPKQSDEWRLSDEYLRLERAIVETPDSKRWQGFAKEWEVFETHFIALVQQGPDKMQWLNSLKTMFQGAWNEQFRQHGVAKFFEVNARDLPGLVAEIVKRVEASLFQNWREGEKALSECGRIVEALIGDLEARAATYDEFIQKQNAKAQEQQRLIMEIENEWGHWLPGDLMGKRPRLIQRMGLALREQSVVRTRAEAERFAKTLNPGLRASLDELRRRIAAAEAKIGKEAEEARRIAKARRPKEKGKDEEPSYVALVGDPNIVETVRRKLVLDKDEQRGQTAAVRSAIIAALGYQPNFGTLSLRLSGAEISNTIVKTCTINVDDTHQRLIEDRNEKVIGVSIIEKLQQEWGEAPEALARQATRLANSATRFVVFDNTERDRNFLGRVNEQRAKESFAVMMPMPANQLDYVTKLQTAFKGAKAGTVNILPTKGRNSEISLVSLVNLFPLRFVRLVGSLRQEYEKRLAESGARASLEIHSEGDGAQLPELFVPGGQALWKKARTLLLLAKAAGSIVEVRNAATGKVSQVLNTLDRDGMIEPLPLGSDLIDISQTLDESQIIALQGEVERALRDGKCLSNEDRQGALTAMSAVEGQMAERRGGDITDPAVAEWRDARKKAMAVLRREETV
ncbi:hypothetical protein M2323_001973 [Rhodoblastus acidophilus]|uniref:tubulin-like doman-containing protein n=1 Tax=Rhodoblastus acidophilus TaxID=1074 RepID=UPI002224F98C|nr:tubulin-like doman-containing protein [Rhodoblastus acidophilus]MCW2285679.1 hypothetical protein [Rhodoblastus acidophilus]MCW2333051.1 hypothetical protein [Rhodoblastus acidophilus]